MNLRVFPLDNEISVPRETGFTLVFARIAASSSSDSA